MRITRRRYETTHSPADKFVDVRVQVTLTLADNPLIYISFLQLVSSQMLCTSESDLFSHHRALNDCDSVIVSSPSCFDVEGGREGFNEWLGRTSRPWFSTGPLLPLTKGAGAQEVTLSQDGAKIHAFMEETLRSRGPKSMIFVSHSPLAHVGCTGLTSDTRRSRSARSSGPRIRVKSGLCWRR